MSRVHEYKKLENSLVRKAKNLVIALARAAGGVVKGFFKFLARRYTVVLVPHSEKKVYNFHITVFSVCCFVLFVAGLIGTFFWYGASYTNTASILAGKESRLQNTQASLDQLRDEVTGLLREARNFETALSWTLSALGADTQPGGNGPGGSGDLSAFFDIRETPEGTQQEVEDVRRLSTYLASAQEPIREIGTLLDSQSALLTEIPSIWPIRGGIGHISMFFGQNEHPVTHQYYIHKGIDLSTYRSGDPIVATADGQVVTIDFEPEGFGNYVIIKHKHGYYTRYAHLQKASVRIGQRVQQNEVIGFIGNTGLSTGPHLHYEVHIGSDVVDPYKYINIRSRIARSTPR
ncbi:MAG: M23 family metallopeptidase [Treponema sp.]|nr:M23 family metallopeptidase [Treponema sp.]